MIPQLMKDHNIIYNKLKEIRKDIIFDGTCNYEEFKDFLLKHKDFEESSFYPLLDEELDENTKKMIINHINEIKIIDSGLKNIKVNCSECGKKIGILKGYYHPKLEKRWLLCKECYDKI